MVKPSNYPSRDEWTLLMARGMTYPQLRYALHDAECFALELAESDPKGAEKYEGDAGVYELELSRRMTRGLCGVGR